VLIHAYTVHITRGDDIGMPFAVYVVEFGCMAVIEKYKKWLMPSDPSTNHHNASKMHHLGTGRWLLKHQTYINWKEDADSFVWIHGIGKQAKAGNTY
jgi:hypothetical protein